MVLFGVPPIRQLAALLIVALAAPACRSGRPSTTSESDDAPAEPKQPRERTVGSLDAVAAFETLEPGGLAVSKRGRIFVAFPRYDPGIPYTLAEIVDGEPKPYPSRALNNLDEDDPANHLLSVEGLTIGPTGDLWVLDSGRPNFDPLIEGGAKLLRIDLEGNDVERSYELTEEALRSTSLLAGVRIDLRHRREGVAYMTDASPSGFNGLVVLDLATGESWRKLDLHPSTRADPEFVGIVEGRRFLFDPANAPPSPLSMGANGLAVGADGERLYYRPMAGRELYSVKTSLLADPAAPPDRVAASLRRYGDQGFASDGLAADDRGAIYLTNYEDNAVVRRNRDGTYETIVHDPRLLWPDSLAISDGWLYIATSQTHREGVFNDGETRVERPVYLYRTPVDAGPVRLK